MLPRMTQRTAVKNKALLNYRSGRPKNQTAAYKVVTLPAFGHIVNAGVALLLQVL